MKERITYLLQRYLEQDISENELNELTTLLNNDEHADNVKEAISALMLASPVGEPVNEPIWQDLFTQIVATERATEPHTIQPVRGIRKMMRYAAGFAAAAGIASLFFYTVYQSAGPEKPALEVTESPAPIIPGTDRAILVLEDGTAVHLDKEADTNRPEAAAGYTYNQQELVYSDPVPAATANQATAYHRIVVPKGGQYRVTLPDGTRAWLNAETELRYPVQFTQAERTIELRGEAYFEVTDDKHKPFRIRIDGRDHIQVLGTRFNVMAYADEPQVKTSLYEGSVKITEADKTALLRPGQQSVADKKNRQLMVRPLQSTDDMAWREGYFVFDGETIQAIMKKISRWYDVEIEYRGTPTNELFRGTVSRFEQVSDVLNTLELTGIIQFSIQERRIIVTTL